MIVVGFFKLFFEASGRFLVFCFVGAVFLALCGVAMIGIGKLVGSEGTIKTYDRDGVLIEERNY